MSSKAWTQRRFSIPNLRVPVQTQPDNEEYCVPYAIWMATTYVANECPNPSIRSKVAGPSVDEILDYLTVDVAGWRPDQEELTQLATHIGGLMLSLDSWYGDAPQELCEIAADNLDNDLPLIGIIEAQTLRERVTRTSSLHAVVIAGVGADTAVIADPWFARLEEVERDKLEDAWDPTWHQIIEVDLLTR